jgi:rRNA maturation protein Nop10
METCKYCGAEYAEPYMRHYFENLDGESGVEERMEEVCPYCGESVRSPFEEEILL